ncbi:MAG: hypothetical protein R3E21_08185 [Caenibius sp.]
MTPPISNLSTLRERLRQLADDCQERARLANDADARSQYHCVAKDARLFARMPHMGEEGLKRALVSVGASMAVAAWLDGDTLPDAHTSPLESIRPLNGHRPPPAPQTTLSESPAPPADALNARQLASLLSMPERSARRAIERGVRKGLPGFYRDGRRWYARRDAFERLRCA